VIAVIKADAYGHGAFAAARALSTEADVFAVACIEEALELREAGIDKPVLLLEGCFEPDELALVERHGFITVVHCPEQLELLLAARPGRPLPVWLKMDSGMHRLGLAPERFAAAWQALHDCPHATGTVLMTHFARADELDQDTTRAQIALFERHAEGIPAPRSLANSAATLAWPESHGDWLRPGFMLYGWSPLNRDHPNAMPLRPVMALESALIAIRDLPAGEAIGYAGRYVTDRPTRVGTVAMGYADGYPRHARDGTPVAVNGRMTRLIGRVSMDMLTVDLSEQPEARVGDPVELWGPTVSANAVAAHSDTIAYSLLTGVTRRVPRRYRE
jgi:alanine racemase